MPKAHAAGHNDDSVAVCLIGGIDRNRRPDNNFTPEQWRSLEIQLTWYLRLYRSAVVVGHNTVSNKACPSFDVDAWVKERGIYTMAAAA